MLDVPSLHVITDEQLQARFSHVELCRELVAGGADAIQFREKRHATTAELCAIACEIASICAASKGTGLIVNDRVDVALACGANGVHLGSNDLDLHKARQIARDQLIIGGTANSLEEAETTWSAPVDYLGVGPVFGTQSKASPAPVLGLEQLRIICERSPKPVIAIGNIRLDNLREVILAGAAGIAVLSAIVCAPDPRAATRSFKRSLAEAASALG